MMQDNIEISELYNDGSISGETYLYCVENDIDTVQDVIAAEIPDGVSDIIATEFNYLKNEFGSNSIAAPINILAEDDPIETRLSAEDVEAYISYINSILEQVNAETRSIFSELQNEFTNNEEFILFLLNIKTRNDLPESINAEGCINDILNIVYDFQALGRKYSIVDEILTRCDDARSSNILHFKYKTIGNKLEFGYWLETCTRTDIGRLNNCGRKSFTIIWDLIQRLRILCIESKTYSAKESSENLYGSETSEEAKRFWDLIETQRQYLSVRANHVLSQIIADRHNSIEEILSYFRTPNLSFQTYRNCGRKADKELRDFRNYILANIGDIILNSSETTTPESKKEITSEREVDAFTFIIESKRIFLSRRANNILSFILQEYNGRYDKLLELFKVPRLSFVRFRNCGKGTDKELIQFKDEIITYLNEEFGNDAAIDDSSQNEIEKQTEQIFINKSFELIIPIIRRIINNYTFSSREVFSTVLGECDLKPNQFYDIILNTTRPIVRYFRTKLTASIEDVNSLKEQLLNIYKYKRIIEHIYLQTQKEPKLYPLISSWLGVADSMQEFVTRLTSLNRDNISDIIGITGVATERLLNLAYAVRDISCESDLGTDAEGIYYGRKIREWATILSLPFSDIKLIYDKYQELGSFPLFLTLQKHIDNLPERDRIILLGQIDIYNDQVLELRDDIANTLKVSRERVRQLRSKVFKDLQKYIISIRSIEKFTYETIDAINCINTNEGTNFQDNFIYWTLSLIDNSKWTIIGNIEDVFFNPHGHQINLNMIPTSLGEVYNFHLFIKEFDKLYNERRTVTYELNLQSFCLNYFKNSILVPLLDEIIFECKKIILRLYGCTSDGNTIYVESNAYRGLSEITEEILRENGSPMTADEIYSTLLEKYPNQKCKGASSLIGSIHNNPNIKPLGRSGRYTLQEWNLGESRGGTIREFAEEYILQTEGKIAPLEEIGNYVRRYRPTSTDASIQANLMAETSGKFALYTKDDVKHIGFSARKYDETFIPAEESMVIVRSFETSKRLFEEFIIQNKRFPFLIGDDIDESEKRLRRFYNNVLYRCKRGVGSKEDLSFIEYIETTYAKLDIPRNEYKWKETHSSICKILELYGRDGLSTTEQHWCYKYLRLQRENKLEEWQVVPMINLQLLYAKG